MNMRNIFAATLVSAIMITMGSVAFAKDPGPMQQQPPKMQQQVPGKPGHVQAPPKKQKVRFIRVHRGDTLGKIAHKYHTSVTRLKRLNHLRGDRIFVGQRLRVR